MRLKMLCKGRNTPSMLFGHWGGSCLDSSTFPLGPRCRSLRLRHFGTHWVSRWESLGAKILGSNTLELGLINYLTLNNFLTEVPLMKGDPLTIHGLKKSEQGRAVPVCNTGL